MSLTEYTLKYRPVVLFLLVLTVAAGFLAYSNLGQLEDPEFTIKRALVITPYPGASPIEVEEQVTDEVEKAVQGLATLDRVHSISRAGLSLVYVDIDQKYRAPDMPAIWTDLRHKVADMQPKLPEGAMPSQVMDDFGDVFGIFLALTGDGYTYADLRTHAEMLQREFLLVEDVAKVEIWGVREECIYVRFSRARLAEARVRPEMLIDTLQRQNVIIDAGSIEAGSERIRLTPTGTFQSVSEIGDLVLRGLPQEDLVYLRDVAEVERGYVDPPQALMRFNGRPAIGIAVSTVPGGNVVAMGEALRARLDELTSMLPHGMELGDVAFQGETVRQAVRTFVLNLGQSVTIVIIVLLITMGLRSGLIIGSGLVLTILGSFAVMYVMDIDLQRTSLGALILAMGMLVDNAIVVTEGALIRLQRGESRKTAVTQPVREMAWPLLGATLIAILAFLPVFLSEEDTGEYTASLFQVVAISLGISWILAVVATPVLCDMFLEVSAKKSGQDPYAGRVYRSYRRVLEAALRHRVVTIGIMLGLLAAAGVGFQYVEQSFFPSATRAQFMVDYWLPEGSRIEQVSEDIARIEAYLEDMPEVVSTAACIGAGPPRFYLPYEPELPNSSYGQIIVNVAHERDVGHVIPQVEAYVKSAFPLAEPRVREFPLGPANPFKIEARFSGPDPRQLRLLANRAKEIMARTPGAKDIRDDWRQRVKTWEPEFSQPRGRRALVSRQDVALALRRVTEGIPVGYYRERDQLLPIIVKAPDEEKRNLDDLANVPVWGLGPVSVPLSQVVSEVRLEWEDPIRRRRNRQLTITAQCEPEGGDADALLAELRPQIEAITLPEGYRLEWGGDYEDATQAQEGVFAKLPIALMGMALIVVVLFNAFRQPLIIVLILPLSLIGITVGLLVTGQPFGFMALVGALSLFGMLIKNAVVLIDQTDSDIRSGEAPYDAVVQSSVSRLRPVMMASMTTVLAMTPLVTDRLFSAMAVAIMSGLTFATVLTLIVVPVLYAIFFGIASPEQQ